MTPIVAYGLGLLVGLVIGYCIGAAAPQSQQAKPTGGNERPRPGQEGRPPGVRPEDWRRT